jgi:peptidoglycan/LPS O-acetylase OafA/YrhL
MAECYEEPSARHNQLGHSSHRRRLYGWPPRERVSPVSSDPAAGVLDLLYPQGVLLPTSDVKDPSKMSRRGKPGWFSEAASLYEVVIGPRKIKGRADIQGLRALAVGVVIANHLFRHPGGGFVGVDIFFVISGFLITGHLLREHEATGHISYLGFYVRRIKRIIPAAVLVLIVGTVWSYFVFSTPRWHSTRLDALFAFLFSANFRFESQSTNYFADNGLTSPFQHYWSLSVEEQFYFVWPWLMLLIFALLLRRQTSRRAAHTVVFAVLGIVTVASFVFALHQSASSPAAAYFDTRSRIWELGVGAVLAGMTDWLVKIPRAIRPLLAWIGIAAMVWSVFAIKGSDQFPAPWAAVPVLGSALAIAAGTFANPAEQQRFLFPFTTRLATYVGDISYSLYVWHFPIIIIGIAEWGDSTATKIKLLVTLILVSAFAYSLVEDPIRRYKRDRSHHRERRSVFGVLDWIDTGGKTQYTLLSAMVIGLVALVAIAVRPTHVATGITVALPNSDTSTTSGPHYGPEVTSLQKQIVSALAATSWPSDLHPSMDQAIGGPETAADLQACGSTESPVNLSACGFGASNSKHTAMIVGDSVSMTYATALRQILAAEPGWRVYVAGSFGCTFTSQLIANTDSSAQNACPNRKNETVAAIKQVKPDLLFVANLDEPRPTLAGPNLTASQFAQSTETLLKTVQPSVGKIVLLSSPPPGKDPGQCYTKGSAPEDCASPVDGYWVQQSLADQAAMKDLNGVWVDSRPWFCVDNECPAFVSTTPVKVDSVHMTTQYALKVAPAIKETLESDGVLSGGKNSSKSKATAKS